MRPLTADRSNRQSHRGAEAARCGQRCFYGDGWDTIRGGKVRANTPAALYEVRIRRLPDAMARAEWQVPRQRMRRYCGRRASRYAHRVPIAARAPRLGLTHALQKRHQVSGPLVCATNTGQAGELGFDQVRRKERPGGRADRDTRRQSRCSGRPDPATGSRRRSTEPAGRWPSTRSIE